MPSVNIPKKLALIVINATYNLKCFTRKAANVATIKCLKQVD